MCKNNVLEKLERAPSQRRGDTFVVLATRTTTLSGKTDRNTSAGWACSPRVGVRDERRRSCGERDGTVAVGEANYVASPAAVAPINWNLDR